MPVFWKPEQLVDLVRLEPVLGAGRDILVRFDPLTWPGAKTLCVSSDGTLLLLDTPDGRTHRLWLPQGQPEPGAPLVAVVDLGPHARERGEAAIAFWRDVLELGRPARRKGARTRGAAVRGDALRRVLILRALDGDRFGASYREIAEVLYGEARVRANGPWKTNSFRYKVINLIEAGRALMRGGYRQLLKPAKGHPPT